MSLNDLGSLPDEAMVPMKWVRMHFIPRVNSEHRDMTTVELSEEFGHSPDWWQDRARSGKIHGAYQGGVRGRWYVPREHAKVFLRNLMESKRKGHREHRPWKGPKREAA